MQWIGIWWDYTRIFLWRDYTRIFLEEKLVFLNSDLASFRLRLYWKGNTLSNAKILPYENGFESKFSDMRHYRCYLEVLENKVIMLKDLELFKPNTLKEWYKLMSYVFEYYADPLRILSGKRLLFLIIRYIYCIGKSLSPINFGIFLQTMFWNTYTT